MTAKEWSDLKKLLNILDIKDILDDIKDAELKKLLDDASDMLDDMEREITKELIWTNIKNFTTQ